MCRAVTGVCVRVAPARCAVQGKLFPKHKEEAEMMRKKREAEEGYERAFQDDTDTDSTDTDLSNPDTVSE